MTNESRAKFNREPIFRICEEMGEAAVLADLERSGLHFKNSEQQWLAWEWIYDQRIEREKITEAHVRDTAKYTMLVALGTFLVALFTFGLSAIEFLHK